MSQEKQKTVRILQAKKSSSKKPRLYLLIGFFSGVLTTALCIFLYSYSAFGGLIQMSVSKDPSSDYSSQPLTDENLSRVDQDNRIKNVSDEDQQINHISDKELRKIFKPPATSKKDQQLTIDLNAIHAKDLTPFEKIGSQDVSTQKTQAPRIKTSPPNKQTSKITPDTSKAKGKQTSGRKAQNNKAKSAHIIDQKRRIYSTSTVISV